MQLRWLIPVLAWFWPLTLAAALAAVASLCCLAWGVAELAGPLGLWP
jgi:hypothetical protein